jgi:hypothetical protein
MVESPEFFALPVTEAASIWFHRLGDCDTLVIDLEDYPNVEYSTGDTQWQCMYITLTNSPAVYYGSVLCDFISAFSLTNLTTLKLIGIRSHLRPFNLFHTSTHRLASLTLGFEEETDYGDMIKRLSNLTR